MPKYLLADKTCPQCGDIFTPNSPRRRFCSPICGYRWQLSTRAVAGRGKSLNGSTGAIGELQAAADLLSRGYHVFRSVSPACPCDLVIMTSAGKLLRVEVKTVTMNKRTGRMSDPACGHNEFDVIACVCDGEIIYIPQLGGMGGGIMH